MPLQKVENEKFGVLFGNSSATALLKKLEKKKYIRNNEN